MNNNTPHSNHHPRRHGISFRSLTMAVVVSVCGMAATGMVYAQATVGNVFGKAPPGDTIMAKSTTTGIQRQDQADAKGRYDIGHLPTGNYTVTLVENGQPVVKHINVPVVVGRGIKVDFDCTQGQCAELASQP